LPPSDYGVVFQVFFVIPALFFVIPAQAGIQYSHLICFKAIEQAIRIPEHCATWLS